MSASPPKPNFFSNHTVTLNVPLHEAFPILATSAGHERVCRLSKLCTGFELLQRDTVFSGPSGLGDGTRFRTMDPGTAPSPAPEGEGVHEGKTVHRQHFNMTETVPVLFGLMKSDVHLAGTLSWVDIEEGASTGQALYESLSDGVGITVWKLRVLEEVDVEEDGKVKGKGTRVTERIEGWAPALLRAIVERACAKAHRLHMEQFHTLFSKDGDT
ncbi:hypothetical protein K443DRAFT_9413 [Laccaria amethystina LaAM-08-1]|uniref:Uncharacterized protein n=1 Tax=Laccaria amethystina LaAM-08-1 TaxID=1095629 RepID=A0A0C9WMG0_9AGAR|nr:hypothetical protein K443DRAFT_9413 [Laccaria amethystina LaAM-08-1]